MSGTTSTQGYPYPLTSDFADVQDSFRLATAIDEDLRAAQEPFRAFEGRPSFIARQTIASSGFVAGEQGIALGQAEWDNVGGLVGSGWNQPFAQQPSWWMFGMTLVVTNLAGAVVGDLVIGNLTVTTSDPATGVVSSSAWYQRNDESNTSGEWLNLFAMAPIYQGSVRASLILNGSTSKAVAAGTRLWGMYLGPVV